MYESHLSGVFFKYPPPAKLKEHLSEKFQGVLALLSTDNLLTIGVVCRDACSALQGRVGDCTLTWTVFPVLVLHSLRGLKVQLGDAGHQAHADEEKT